MPLKDVSIVQQQEVVAVDGPFLIQVAADASQTTLRRLTQNKVVGKEGAMHIARLHYFYFYLTFFLR